MFFLRKLNSFHLWSFSFLWLSFLFLISLFADFIANDKPLYAQYKNKTYFPAFYDILYELGLYQWESDLINKDWKKLNLQASLWAPIPFSPEQLDMENSPASPPFSTLKIQEKKYYHYLGTDELGRDIASGLVYGTRYAIIISFSATFLATLFGVFMGAIAGFWGDYDFKLSRYSLLILFTIGFWAFFICFYVNSYALSDALSKSFYYFLWEFVKNFFLFVLIIFIFHKLFSFIKTRFSYWSHEVSIPLDILISRLIEIKLSIPILLLIIILTAIAKPSLLLLISIIAFGQWTTFARLIRAEILKIKNLDYVLAAKNQGFSQFQILIQQVIPNALPPIWVSISFAIATAILVESALSFLGLGVNYTSWGTLLKSGRNNLDAWWLIVFPGLMIFFTIFALNKLSEFLRKYFNPKKL